MPCNGFTIFEGARQNPVVQWKGVRLPTGTHGDIVGCLFADAFNRLEP